MTEPKHEPCPDCGDDPTDKDLHKPECPRAQFDVGHPGEYLQFGSPWQPWPLGAPKPDEPSKLSPFYLQFVERYVAEHGAPAVDPNWWAR